MSHTVAVINGKAPSGGSGGVSDADLSNIAVNFLTSGVVLTDDYKVQAKGTPDMSVDVLTGKSYVPNASGAMLYHTYLDTTANVVIATNSSGNPRIDAIVIKIDLGVTPNSSAGNVATLIRVEGTPAASPSAPSDSAIQTAVGAGNPFLRLANVTVANGAASITNSDIADARSVVALKNVTKKRVTSVSSSTTPTPNADTTDMYIITALAGNATFGSPTGTPSQGQGLVIRIKDNGTARTLAWNAVYRPIGNDLPTTTTINKTTYLGFIYNQTDTKWDLIAKTEE